MYASQHKTEILFVLDETHQYVKTSLKNLIEPKILTRFSRFSDGKWYNSYVLLLLQFCGDFDTLLIGITCITIAKAITKVMQIAFFFF